MSGQYGKYSVFGGSGGGGTVTSVTASSPLSSSGGNTPDISLSGTVAINHGGTGQVTASAAINALLPTQTSNSGKFLTTNGTVASWATVSGTGGISTINTLNATDQFLVTGTAGTDFTIASSVDTHTFNLPIASASNTGKLSNTDWSTFNGKQAAGSYITALTGDITASGPGSASATLATVNSNVGSFGSSTAIPSFTVNGKGLITAASSNVVIAPAGTLTGATLASNVLSSSLTSVGTLTSGTWSATTIAIAKGGTGQTTANTAFNALAPDQTSNSGKFLTTDGTDTSWATVTGGITQLTGDVTAGPGSGSQAATVASVGGSTASAVNTATVLANAATALNTSSAIVKRDGSGNFAAGTITASLSGNATNVTGIVLPANGGTGIANNNASTLTISGNFDTTLTVTGSTAITLPTSGTLVTTSASQLLTNKTFNDAVTMAQVSTPSNPSAGFDRLYFKSDDNLYALNSAGVEIQFATGSSSYSPSEIWLTDAAGYGSAGTTVVRFSTVQVSTGSDFTYTSDSTNGDYITVNNPCTVSVTVNTDFSSASNMGITVAGTGVLTYIATGIPGIPFPISKGYIQTIGAGTAGSYSATFNVTTGDVIRMQTQSVSFASFCSFRVTKTN